MTVDEPPSARPDMEAVKNSFPTRKKPLLSKTVSLKLL